MIENQAGKTVKIIGLGGGLGKVSRSLTILKMALASAEQAGAETELLYVGDLNLPFFVPDQPVEEYPQPELIKNYLENMRSADGFIWSSPVYHGTVGAPFKNALDLLELLPRRPKLYLEGKVVGLMAVAGGQFAAPQAISAMWHSARALKLLVSPTAVPISRGKQLFDPEGNLLDEKTADQIAVLGREITELSRLYRHMPKVDTKREIQKSEIRSQNKIDAG